MSDGVWEVWIDTGGTFTDCVGVSPAGEWRRAKVLSSGALRGRVEGLIARDMLGVEADWGAPSRFIDGMEVRFPGLEPPGFAPPRAAGYDAPGGVVRLDRALPFAPPAGAVFEVRSGEEAPVLAARLATGTPGGRPLPPIRMRLGTTRGTNALLEHRGAPVVLFVTRGFRDLLEIGTQQRPDLFALRIVKPEPLYAAVVEVPERLAPDGSIVEPLDLPRLEADVARVLGSGRRVAAVALLHAWANPAHERRLAEFLRSRGFGHVSCSADLSPTLRILPRAQTAVVDAYLAPVVGAYLDRVAAALGPAGSPGAEGPAGGAPSLRVMTSAGGLVSPGAFRPKDSLLSGPAGGVVGAAWASARSGLRRVIAFDMGGTSTDVCRLDDAAAGSMDFVYEHEVGGARIAAPAVGVESVAAGGGSVCWFDGEAVGVGPASAGADPGPACYGAGGPLTVTDANLLLGRLHPARFAVPVSEDAARARLEDLRRAMGGRAPEAEPLLEGFLAIACERTADAIRRISIQRGYDPAEYALLAFGGAGGQHACAVAARLGMTEAIVPADAGLLSALGLGHAAVERVAQRQVLQPLSRLGAGLEYLVRVLEAEARAALATEGVSDGVIRRRTATLRFVGQETGLEVEFVGAAGLRAAFKARHRDVYGHAPPGREVEVESVCVVASSRMRPVEPPAPGPEHEATPVGTRRAWFGGWVRARVYERERLRPGAGLAGPALVLESGAATVVEPGWACRVDGALALRLTRTGGPPVAPELRAPEAIRVELATGRLATIAREMGEMLRRTALSTNVKERLDFSCAVLDADANLVVNAPHIPVHLGALGVCVRTLRDRIEMGPGDTVATNHPAFGGSHLPDVTVVTPVHDGDGSLLAYVASRAHHAEIGGRSPGSMPTDARSLAEEGVVIPPVHLIRTGRADWAAVERALISGPWPTRALADNLADLNAQVAANRRGAAAILRFARERGAPELRDAMRALTDRAERRAARLVAELSPRLPLEAVERLDDGTPIRVRLEAGGPGLVVDFAGTGGVHPANLNATPAIVRSVLIYVMRLLAAEPMPLNEGLLRVVEARVPRGLLDPDFPDDASRCPPVAGGNVETSQRVVDTLLKALGACACSQGTMNNVVFGDERYGYYETVGGGSGAGPGFDGADAVHTHMTNTRITDPEVLERRHPVRLVRFEIRRGSGGRGRWRGGDGVVRELLFLEPCSLTVLGQHRVEGPYGMDGGEPGRPGCQRLVHASGAVEGLPPLASARVLPGDRLVLETPGGGGWGDPRVAAENGGNRPDGTLPRGGQERPMGEAGAAARAIPQPCGGPGLTQE